MPLFGKRQIEELRFLNAALVGYLEEAESNYLEVLRRELANLIIGIDPDLMLRCYKRAWDWERETAANPERLRADEASLKAKLGLITNFDILVVRHFVTYAEAQSFHANDELVERYLEIGRMLVFLKNKSKIESRRNKPLHDSEEYEKLFKNMRRVKDRDLRARIEDALRRAYAYRNGVIEGSDKFCAGMKATYSESEIEVFHMPYGDSPENKTGIIFKKTEEYAVHTFFVSDDKTFYSYYRSDREFKERHPLLER